MPTITFNNIPANYVSSYSEAGFTASGQNNRSLFGDTSANANNYNYTGSSSVWIPYFGDQGFVTADNGSAFSVTSVDANTVYRSSTVVTQTYTGLKADGTIVTASFALDTNPATLQTYNFNGAFDNIVRFGFNIGSSSDGGSPFAQIDNLVVTDAATPGAFSVADVSVVEGDTLSQTGQFAITRTASQALSAATIGYTISNGGASNVAVAQAGVDYSAPASGTVSFAAGQASAIVQFTVIGDTLVEGNEQFKLTLSNPTTGGTITKQIGYATIVDNDVPAGSTAQQGTSGNDTLIAQGPNSILVGGAGNDTFLVHGMGDVVVENNGGGTDIVYTDVSYNLGSNEVEALSFAQQTDTSNINLIGNFVSQTIVGNYGNNILNGGSGADTLIGLFGSDTYAVGDSRIVIQEQDGQGNDIVVTSVDYTLGAGASIETFGVQDRASTAAINLTGNEIAQTIVGSEGANVINGGAGSDTLIGFGGADTFAFTTALGATNVDTIVDFTAGTDRIALGSSIFAAIGTTLDASEFVTGTAATTASQFIVYNASTGALFYDADGSGAGAAVQFAAIAPNIALTEAMFTVV